MEKGNRLARTRHGKECQRGGQSRRKEERSICYDFRFLCARRELAVATRRSIDVPRRRPLSLSLAHSLVLPSCLPIRHLCYIREGGIIEIARRRGAPDGEGNVGSAGIREPPATDQQRPCACFLFSSLSQTSPLLDDGIRAVLSNHPCPRFSLVSRYRKYEMI